LALATRCPHCHTLFRVGAEQLRSRNGMVRCGSCRQVFNAVGHLDYVEPPATQPAAPALAAPPTLEVAPAPATARPPAAPRAGPNSAAEAHDGAGEPPIVPAPPRHAERRREARALAEAAPASAAPGGTEEAGPDTVFDQIEEDARGEAGEHEGVPDTRDEPDFLRRAASRPLRAARIAMTLGAVLMLPVLLAQLALLFRADLLARLPESRPLIEALCVPLDCKAQWPMRPEYLAMVSSELQAIPGTKALEFDAVVRNRAQYPLALPAIELTLTDNFDRTLARKVFLPADYLALAAPGARPENLGAEADLSLRLLFEAPAPNVTGFVAYPFYP
jgi:predicted Zn finger-like uncharacterized protein